jgi:ankyrin repeat protein
MFEACAFGRYEDAMKLVHLGADVSKGQYRGNTQLQWPLHAACRPQNNFEEPPRHLPLKLSADADKKAHKRVELIETLLRQGADIEAKSVPDEESPLYCAAKNDLGPALHALLAAGARVESRE